jgi:two-component system alkaline phosphatase synthesis response regulator PhoP
VRAMTKEYDSGALILVVEDVEEIRDGIEKLLTADGYRVDPARSEEDAIARARREQPNLILISLGPHVDLVATVRRIRECAELSDEIPVLIFCVETIAEGDEVKIGTNVYVTRPDSFDQLRNFMGRLLRRLPLPS